MSSQKSGNGLAFLLGIAFGALVGGGVSFLFASKKGEATRKKLRKKTEDLKGKVSGFYQDLREAAQPVVENQLEDFKPIVDEVGGVMRRGGEDLKGAVQGKVISLSSNLSSNLKGAKKRFFRNLPSK